MVRRLLLLALTAVAAAALIPAPASAVNLGRGCVRNFGPSATYGCGFTATGQRLRIAGNAFGDFDGSPATLTLWVTASSESSAPRLLSCSGPALPGGTTCRAAADNQWTGMTLFCWGKGAESGTFACLT